MQHSGRATDPPRTPLATDPTRRRLTPREREVALLVGDGLDDAEIGRRLGLTLKTVGSYVQRVRLRLGLASRRDIAPWVNARRDSNDPGAPLRRADDDERRLSETHRLNASSAGQQR
jgi:DNA-binding CsgD family transcriptional regulator